MFGDTSTANQEIDWGWVTDLTDHHNCYDDRPGHSLTHSLIFGVVLFQSRQSYEQSVIWYNNLFSDDSQACVDDKLLLTYLNQTQIENRAGWWGFSAPKSIKIYTAI